MKILIAPLNWGLGHASRCIPIIRQHLHDGDEVVLGGDGESLHLLQKHFPDLRVLPLAPLHLHYSKHRRQVGAMLLAVPRLILSSIIDHRLLRYYLRMESFDLVISDNRFGLYTSSTRCVYMTHQLHIRLPHPWRWLEPLARAFHARVYKRYNEVWVPDYAGTPNLSGWLGHDVSYVAIRYIGPQSRFLSPISYTSSHPYSVVAVLSGLEPQRTLLEKELRQRYADTEEEVLIVQGLIDRPSTPVRHRHITTVPHLNDAELAAALLGAQRIIVRSGYSTIMDLDALGLLSRAELIPTPGQPEQEYLASLHRQVFVH